MTERRTRFRRRIVSVVGIVGAVALSMGTGPLTVHASSGITSTVLTSSNNPAATGQAVTLTATVTTTGNARPTGTVQFKEGAGALQGSSPVTVAGAGPHSGTATLTTSTLTPGVHLLTAVYSGDTNNTTSTSNTLTQIVSGLRLTPAGATVAAGTPQTFSAHLVNSLGVDLGDVTASTTFTISPNGSCSGASCTASVTGTHTVTGTDGSATGTATLTVTAGTLDHLVLSPASATVTAGGSQAYSAEGFDHLGNDLGDVTASTTFTIGPNGSCTGATCAASTTGAHTVTGADGTATGTATLTVTGGSLDHLALSPAVATIAAGATPAYTAEGFDHYGNDLGDVTGSTTFGIAPDGTCTGASCTATVPGVHTVTGTDGGADGTATLTVTPGPLDHLVLSPHGAGITAGGGQGYTAEGFDQFGSDLGDVTASTTFTIGPDGSCTGATCTATLAGAHTVTGTDGTATGTAALAVTAAAIDHLVLSPAGADITAGGSRAYTAEGFDQFGNDLGDVTASATFTIAPDGSCTGATCTATVAGAHAVTATVGAAGGTAGLSVSAGPIDHLVVQGGAGTIAAGGSGAYTAEAFDQFGNDLGDVTASTTFTIAPDGSCTGTTCTATTAGAHTVTGTDGSSGGTADLTVTPGPLDHLGLGPASGSFVAGGSQTYTAEGFDQYGNDLGDATASTTFTIAPDGSCTGATCTATVAGSHTVTGSDGTAQGTGTIDVVGGPVDHLTLAASGGSIAAGGSQAYTAEGFDQFGNDLGDVTSSTTFGIVPDGSCTGASCTATTAGAHTVTGADGVASGRAALTVTAGPLDHLVLTPAGGSIVAGGSQAYTAEGFDTFGNDLGDVTSSTTFTIDPNGSCAGATCTATTAGAHTVTGTDGGATGSTGLSVTSGPVDHLVLTPAGGGIVAGGDQAYTAEGFDQFGNDVGDVTPSTTFAVTPDGSCTGATCTATAAGDHTVTGTDGSATGDATLTVTAAALDHLVLGPSGASIDPGGSQAYTAEGFDTFGNDLGDVTPSTTFAIDPDGSCTGTVCTATVAGGHTVTGTDGAATGPATLTVRPETVTVVLHSHALRADGGSHTTATATVSDGVGGVAGAVVTWTATPPGSVTFDNGGGGSTSTTDTNGVATITVIASRSASPNGARTTVTAAVPGGSGSDQEKLLGVRFGTVTFTPGTLPADGHSSSTAVATVVDGNGNPVAGETVDFAGGSAGGPTFATPSALTDGTGTATDTITSGQVPGTSTLSVSDDAPEVPSFATSLTLTQLGTNASFVHDAFQIMLGHDADPAGFDYWLNLLNSGAPRSVLAMALATTPEYRNSVIGAAGDNDFYHLYLDRTSDPAGVAYWVGRMAGPNGLSFEQVRLKFVDSPEYFSSPVVGNNDKAAAIAALYDDLLGRTDGGASDPTGFAYWMAHFDRTTIATRFLFSPEGRAYLVNTLYQQILHRNSDPAGLAFWTDRLLHGASDENIIASILGSAEFFESV